MEGEPGVKFAPYTAWADVREVLAGVAPGTEFTVPVQGGFLE
ncbi:hypothetical protein ACWEPM_36265 [Streptomyces sp. NPDC004244]